jgi:hypothetical protein
MSTSRNKTVGKQVVSDDQVRMTVIDDSDPDKPTWSHVFVPKHLTIEREQVTVARGRSGRLWPAALDRRAGHAIAGMSAVLTWRAETYSGRIRSVKQGTAIIDRDG